MKVGVFCGTFDPIHIGHAILANYLSQWGDLDRVLMMVSPLNPFKEGKINASDYDRLEMVRIAMSNCKNVEASDFEFRFPYPTYTYRTLTALRENLQNDEIYLIIGADNWGKFRLWRDADKIISEFKIMIYPRPGYKISGTLPEGVTYLADVPVVSISSTFLRQALRDGRNVNFFIPSEVLDYIKLKELYQN